jgi:hypothetical protein
MVSPHIGLKAGYKNMVFEAKPAEKKKKAPAKKDVPVPAADPSIYRSEHAWNPIDGLQWRPGLPTYKEVFEIVQKIFEKPYSKPGNLTPDSINVEQYAT